MAPIFTRLSNAFGFGAPSGGGGGPAPITATGGDIVDSPGNGYKYHLFSSSGSLVVTAGNDTVEYLIVGGGGSGGVRHAGGGGAGGLRTNVSGDPKAGDPMTLTAGTYPVTVGAGGIMPGPVADPPSLP